MADNVIKFKDFSDEVKAALKQAAVAWLHEASGELKSQVQRNTAVDTGQLKSSWSNRVDENKLEAVIGSPLENAIWEELGTGEFALNGNGRKGGWFYVDTKGEGHFTYGKPPKRALYKAYIKLKPKLITLAQSKFKGIK